MKTTWLRKRFLYTAIFAVAMGFLEAIVVVYLRELYYPTGFHFPIHVFSERIYLIEIIRELATLVMLWMVGMLAGQRFYQRLAFFLFSFGIWDIVYYVALKLFLGWPVTLFTWDILFLIPITWIGPVIAPVICSITMIILSIVLVFVHKKRRLSLMGVREWILVISGSVLVFIAFVHDYTLLMVRNGFIRNAGNLFKDPQFIQTIETFVPHSFGWIFFSIGEILLILSILSTVFRHKVSR